MQSPQNQPSLPRSWVRGPIIAALVVSALAGCADTFRPLGSSAAAATEHAEQLFMSFITRFSPTDYSAKYDAARIRLAQAALIPSRVFNDTAMWVLHPNAETRILYVSGTGENGRYRLDARRALTPTARPGDSRHSISLQRLSEDDYRWDTRVDLAVGSVTAEEISLLASALFRAPEGRTERELRADYTAAFPRAKVAFGHGFTIDSLRVLPGALGTTTVALTVRFHPDLMKAAYPHLAEYLDKYLGPAKYHLALSDRAGTPLLDIVGRERAMTIRYRLEQGKLTTLFGAPRAWPDTLRLTSDVSLKVKIFTVGFRKMVSDFVISNTGHDRSWTVIAQHEPEWDLPFITERLIRSPLRRPFDGAGAMMRLSVRDSAGGQTILSRTTRLEVQESAIMRFLGGLAAHAIGDLDDSVEQEEDRFLRDGFVALQMDLGALPGRWR